MKEIKQTLDAFAAIVTNAGGELLANSIGGPVAEPAVVKAEQKLGYPFPPRFRHFLATQTAAMEFDWRLEDDREIKLDGEREAIYGGAFRWSFDELVVENTTFQAQDIEGDELLMEMVGRDKIILASVGNGDMFAIGISGHRQDKVLYLSHDIDDIHNYIVAADINDLFRRYAPLGFAGPEYWVWELFTNGRTTMIDPVSAKAREFLGKLDRRT